MKLTDEEAMAIRWHMGLSEKDNYNYVSKAFEDVSIGHYTYTLRI